MENWFKESGRPALLEALTEACDQIDNDFNAGMQAYIQNNKQLNIELESLRAKASRVDQLEEENRSLKAEIQSLTKANRKQSSAREQSRAAAESRSFRTPLAPRSVNQVSSSKRSTKPEQHEIDDLEPHELKEEYLRVEGNYTKLRAKFGEVQDTLTESNRLLRDKTTLNRQWVKHANELREQSQNRSRRIRKLEARLAEVTEGPLNSSFYSDAGVVRPSSTRASHTTGEPNDDAFDELGLARPDPIPRDSPVVRPPPILSEAERDSSTGVDHSPRTRSHDATQEGRAGSSTPESEDLEPPNLPPLPKNREEVQGTTLVKTEPSSDTPVVVSARCLRKRKHNDDQAQNIPPPSKLKTEHSSGPLITDERRLFAPHESIDFDVEVNRVQTPRKRNKFHQPREGDSTGSAETTRIRGHSSHSTRRRDLETPLTTGYEQSPHQPAPDEDLVGAHVRERPAAEPFEIPPDRSSALRPLDANTLLPQRAGPTSTSKRRKPTSTQDNVTSIAEDGDQGYGSKTSKGRKSGASWVLHDLLNSPSPERGAIALPSGVQGKDLPTSKPLQFQVPQKRDLPFGMVPKSVSKALQRPDSPVISNSKRTSSAINPKRNTEGTTSNPDADKNTTPLRDIPMSRLGLGDFKVNPAANEGYDYAYTDVVRNKDQRASLPGCTKEGCCGQTFRVLARSEREQTGTIAFQSLLESYLGDDAYKLGSMPSAEKERLWLEAKTEELAKSHGKHKNRYQRMTSPPGYWRTDFPSTQEGEQDKAEAAKMERQMVEERYREAMRPGGRWLFRDE